MAGGSQRLLLGPAGAVHRPLQPLNLVLQPRRGPSEGFEAPPWFPSLPNAIAQSTFNAHRTCQHGIGLPKASRLAELDHRALHKCAKWRLALCGSQYIAHKCISYPVLLLERPAPSRARGQPGRCASPATSCCAGCRRRCDPQCTRSA